MAGLAAHDAATWAGKLAPRRAATARRSWQVLSTILEAAVRAGHLGSNPLRGVPGPKAGPRRREVSSVDDVCRILEFAPDRWRTVLLTFALTGLRWGELAALRPEDLAFDGGAYGAGRISVRRNRPAGRREEGEPKSRAGWRAIDLVAPLRAALLDHAARGGRVFTGARGGPLDHRTFARGTRAREDARDRGSCQRSRGTSGERRGRQTRRKVVRSAVLRLRERRQPSLEARARRRPRRPSSLPPRSRA